MVVEVGLEACNGEVFGEFKDGIGHSAWTEGYA